MHRDLVPARPLAPATQADRDETLLAGVQRLVVASPTGLQPVVVSGTHAPAS